MTKPPLPRSEDSLADGLVLQPTKTRPVSARSQPPRTSLARQWLRLGGITALMMGAGTLVGLSLWTSLVLMLRPHPPRWLATYWPGMAQGWGQVAVQTWAEVDAELQAQGQQMGEPISLMAASSGAEMRGLRLVPVLETRSPCNRDCEAIVELRLYTIHHRDRQTEKLHLLDRLRVQGPTEAEVFKPLAQEETGIVGSTYQLPLTAVKPLHTAGLGGAWLTLTGKWRTQGSPVLYGQMLHINAQSRRIHTLLNWYSPPGRMPTWHNADRQGSEELLVNQSYGLEPDFRLYQVDSLKTVGTPARLREVSLGALPLPPEIDSGDYRNGLFLAQRGLWSHAEQRLLQLKQQVPNQWSLDLEQQLQLISLHARFSTLQADRDWSQPSQKLLALLLDGRWQQALGQLNTAQASIQQAVLPLLQRDSSRLWQRLTATLRLQPQHREARLWSALLLLAKEDEAAALEWLDVDEDSPLGQEFAAIAQIVSAPTPPAALPPLVASEPSPASEADDAAVVAAAPRWNGLVGQAVAIDALDGSRWQRPAEAPPLTLAPGQAWFTVTLQSGHRRQGWQRSLTVPATAFTQPPRQLWQTLGLGASATLQGIDPTSGDGQTLKIMGHRQQGDRVVLLARGVASPRSLLVVTPGLWQAAATHQPVPFHTVLADQPALGDRLLPTLQNHLGLDPAALTTTLQQQAAAIPPLATVQRWQVVDDASTEMLLTLTPELLTLQGLSAAGEQPTQLLLTAQGELLYSNLWSGTAPKVVGWLRPPSDQPALVVRQGDRAQVLFWSPQNRRFQ